MDDADLDAAVRSAIQARFVNCGQVCTCNERTYVHRARYDEFVARCVERSAASSGSATRCDESAEIGPKVSAAEWEKVARAWWRAPRSRAREVALGGGRPDGEQYRNGHWFAPTVLTDVRNDMDIMQQEMFGPVLPVVAVRRLRRGDRVRQRHASTA